MNFMVALRAFKSCDLQSIKLGILTFFKLLKDLNTVYQFGEFCLGSLHCFVKTLFMKSNIDIPSVLNM